MRKLLNKMLWVMVFLFISFPVYAEVVISVLYFENTTKKEEYQWLRKGIADMLITDISKSYQIQVVERENLEKVLTEQQLALSGLIDENQAIEVGKLLNANKVVYGSYIIVGNTIRLDTKITESETGEILKSTEISGNLQDIFSLEKKLAIEILRHLMVSIPDDLEVQETNSLDALKSYYEGVSLFDDDKVEQAVEKFRQASTLDPLYHKPQKGLEESYQFLKDFRNLRKQREIRKLYQKVEKLGTRLKAKKWKTYGDLIMGSNYVSMSPEEQQKFNEENQVYTLCDTRAQCTWHLMLTLYEIGGKYEEYFNDIETPKRLCEEIYLIGERAKKEFKGDPFLSEVLYIQLFALQCLKDYEKLKDYAENFLMEYPDYRLIEFVENFYEEALDNLKD